MESTVIKGRRGISVLPSSHFRGTLIPLKLLITSNNNVGMKQLLNINNKISKINNSKMGSNRIFKKTWLKSTIHVSLKLLNVS